MIYTELPEFLNTTAQVSAFEQYLIQQYTLSEQVLMAAAAEDAYALIRQLWPEKTSVAVVCGAGNNAGDGYTLATLLQKAAITVTVYYLKDPKTLSGAAKIAAAACVELGIRCTPFVADDNDFAVDIIVDAILGTGLTREVSGEYASAIDWLNIQDATILALDVPSGLDANTGVRRGHAIEADVTLCFLGCKQGLLTAAGTECAGDIFWSDLNVPKTAFTQLASSCERLDIRDVFSALPPRAADVNKGDFGRVLIIGGNYGMAGAVCLAAGAALYAGAGLVTVATRPEHVTAVVASYPEALCYGITQAKQLGPLLEKATVVVLGPGLGLDKWADDLWQAVITTSLPLIMDADGLNILATKPMKLRPNWLLTPHPGEAARLLGSDVATIQNDRFQAGLAMYRTFGGMNILKGAGTILTSDLATQMLCTYGNPGMAVAGMGDILSGTIGGLVAQNLDFETAVCTAVMVHAKAGDLAAEKIGERGLLAHNLLPYIRQIVNLT